MTFAETNQLYIDCASVFCAGVEARHVDFSDLCTLDKRRREFSHAIKHHGLSGPWDSAARAFNMMHAKLARTPCSPRWICHEFAELSGATAALRDAERILPSVDPNVSTAFRAAFDALRQLGSIETSPLVSSLQQCGLQGICCVVPMRDARVWQNAQVSLLTAGTCVEWQLLQPSALRSHPSCDCLVIFGPPSFLAYNEEEFLLRAPIAARVVFVGCKHEFFGEIHASLLDDDTKIPIALPSSSNTTRALQADFEPLPPSGGGVFRLKQEPHDDDPEQIVVNAVPFKLGSRKGIFLPNDMEVWLALSDGFHGKTTCSGVEKISVSELEPGQMTIMTTEGGGDMIPVVADMILGTEAHAIRALQNTWKTALKNEIIKEGYEPVIERLNFMGCKKALAWNIRRWCNPRGLGMESEQDLMAVLKLVGFPHRFAEISSAIRKLRAAHNSAGRQIQRRLLSNLSGVDLSKVFTEGCLEVRGEEGSAAKTIFLVEWRGEEQPISDNLVGQLRDLAD